MTSLEAIFDFLATGQPPHRDAGIFGATIPPEEARIHLIGVPWDATSSYGQGSHAAPAAIRSASHQLDLLDRVFGRVYRAGIVLDVLHEIAESNAIARTKADQVIASLEGGESPDPDILAQVNALSDDVNHKVYEAVKASQSQGRFVGLVGGEHSIPFGAIKRMAEVYPSFGILHLDAHHDLRDAYEGFTHSHASIFYNVMHDFPQVERLVSVGIRDFSADEAKLAEDSNGRIRVWYDEDLFAQKAEGTTFSKITDQILAALPETIYLSVDIDVLSQADCPNTGTPVPGGLSFHEVVYLLHRLGQSGRKVIGFDLVEVVPSENSEWDLNVGARLLYKLCGVLAHTQGLLR
ncbi:agmatinase family protein [Myxococcota bacterium]|nr:agmatinase family protein [Myxococcota bacterium]